MKFLDKSGEETDLKMWLDIVTYHGVGGVLSETTVANDFGEITIRTLWLGIEVEDPTVKPYRTLRAVRGRGWDSLQEHDTEADARREHIRWCTRASLGGYP